jgi:hypothetical protein
VLNLNELEGNWERILGVIKRHGVGTYIEGQNRYEGKLYFPIIIYMQTVCKENGKKTRCTERGHFYMLMVQNTRYN